MFRDSTPKQDGFYMPAEWEMHKGTWMMWPYRRDNWRNESGPGQRVFAELANTIAKYETVTMCVDSANFAQAASMLATNVRVVEMSSDDSWVSACVCVRALCER
jgi:agmatine deiminase